MDKRHHDPRVGGGHTGGIWHWPADVALLLQQQSHPRTAESPSGPSIVISICRSPSCRILEQNYHKLPSWDPSLACIKQHPMATRKARDGHDAPCSCQAHSTFLQEEDAAPVYPRFHHGTEDADEPQRPTRCRSFCVLNNMLLRLGEARRVHDTHLAIIQSQHPHNHPKPVLRSGSQRPQGDCATPAEDQNGQQRR